MVNLVHLVALVRAELGPAGWARDWLVYARFVSPH
jgi:hypothetical protein